MHINKVHEDEAACELMSLNVVVTASQERNASPGR